MSAVPASRPQRVLLVGGSSEIGGAIVSRLRREREVEVFLLGRDADRLDAAARTLAASGCPALGVVVVSAAELDRHAGAVSDAFTQAGGFDLVVLALGALGAQEGLDAERIDFIDVLETGFLGAGSLLWHCLRALRAQGHGELVVLSSVAAERQRGGNAAYCAAKAGLDALAQGLSDELRGSGVRVLVVRPGFVTTRMTAGLKRPPMAVTAAAVADVTVAGLAGRAHTVWAPGYLRYVFAVLRHLPRPLFRRLPL
ncbi:MAG: SDR family NAD(P)-dependent oxidoreductase [Solirubrobacteraceae bacterium]